MACVLSSSFISFSKPFETLNKEIPQRRLAIGWLLGPALGNRVIKLKARNLYQGVTSISKIDNDHVLNFGRNFLQLSHHLNVSSIRTHTIIAGFWVGPDVDDGCGFIEAFVDRII